MKTIFSKILETLNEHHISYSKSYVTNSISYYSADILLKKQDVFIPGCLYIGNYCDMKWDADFSHCGFILIAEDHSPSPPEVPACEYVLLDQYVSIQELTDLIRIIFADNFKQMECAEVLISALIKGKGLKYLLDICCDILQNPVILSNPNAQLLMISSKYEISDPAVLDLLENGVSSSNFLSEFEQFDLHNRLRSSTKPILMDTGFSASTKRIVQGIYVSGQLAAILLVLESNKIFSENDISIIQVLAGTIANEIALQGSLQGTLYEYQLLNMLRGESVSAQKKTAWLSALNWQTFSNYRICVIRSKTTLTSSYESFLRKKIRNLSYCKAVYFNNDIVLIINCPSDSLEHYYYEELAKITESMQLYGGLSKNFCTLDDVAAQYKLALEACNICLIMSHVPTLTPYDKVSSFCLIHKAASVCTLDDYISPRLAQLKDYDKKYGTDYYETLYVTLQSGIKNEIIQKLHIHKNTLNYRLQKIEEIIGIDLNNGQTRFDLLLSFQIQQYLNAVASPIHL